VDDAAGLLARARVAIRLPALDPERTAALTAALGALATQAEGDGRRPIAWRSALVAARLHDRLGQSAPARELLAQARRIFQEVRMSAPEPHRFGLESDPEARWLTVTGAGAGDGGRSARAEGRLRRLLRINKRLNGE